MHECILRLYVAINLKQRLIISPYEQVPRDMGVLCVHTHLFLKMILAFQPWIICAYEQVPIDTWMYSEYVRRYS